jgi:hypothetical protein
MVAEIPSMVKPLGNSPTAAQLQDALQSGHAPPSAGPRTRASTARRAFSLTLRRSSEPCLGWLTDLRCGCSVGLVRSRFASVMLKPVAGARS